MDGQAPELAQVQLRRCLSQYVASYAHRAGGDTSLLRLTSGLSDVAAKYSTVSGCAAGDVWQWLCYIGCVSVD